MPHGDRILVGGVTVPEGDVVDPSGLGARLLDLVEAIAEPTNPSRRR